MLLRFTTIFFCFGLCAWGEESLDPSRPYLIDLEQKATVFFNTYRHPYLLCQTAHTFPLTPSQTFKKVKKYFEKGLLKIPGHYGDQHGLSSPFKGVSPEQVPIPPEVVSEDQLKGIENCTSKYCRMKLNIEKEKKALDGSKDKVKDFHRLILSRVDSYIKKKALMGYEERLDNVPVYREFLGWLNFLPKDYPNCGAFLQNAFWTGAKSACEPQGSLLRQEIAELKKDPLQPIWRISEVLEFVEQNRILFAEIHIYTNHFFDSSLRLVEIFPFKGKSALVISDVMEIDTLKLSSVARFFYRGQMESTVNESQEKEIKKIEEHGI